MPEKSKWERVEDAPFNLEDNLTEIGDLASLTSLLNHNSAPVNLTLLMTFASDVASDLCSALRERNIPLAHALFQCIAKTLQLHAEYEALTVRPVSAPEQAPNA